MNDYLNKPVDIKICINIVIKRHDIYKIKII